MFRLRPDETAYPGRFSSSQPGSRARTCNLEDPFQVEHVRRRASSDQWSVMFPTRPTPTSSIRSADHSPAANHGRSFPTREPNVGNTTGNVPLSGTQQTRRAGCGTPWSWSWGSRSERQHRRNDGLQILSRWKDRERRLAQARAEQWFRATVAQELKPHSVRAGMVLERRDLLGAVQPRQLLDEIDLPFEIGTPRRRLHLDGPLATETSHPSPLRYRSVSLTGTSIPRSVPPLRTQNKLRLSGTLPASKAPWPCASAHDRMSSAARPRLWEPSPGRRRVRNEPTPRCAYERRACARYTRARRADSSKPRFVRPNFARCAPSRRQRLRANASAMTRSSARAQALAVRVVNRSSGRARRTTMRSSASRSGRTRAAVTSEQQHVLVAPPSCRAGRKPQALSLD